LLGLGNSLFAQNLSGKWVGYFTIKSGNEEKTYPYEITIAKGNNQIINAVTITRFSNQFTATATARGVFTPNANLLSLQETKFEQLRLDANLQGCLMNNYLTYQKNKSNETLSGTYMATNALNGSDCGMGSVYLARDVMSLKIKSIPDNEKAIGTTKSLKAPKIDVKIANNTTQLVITKDSNRVSTTLDKTVTAVDNNEIKGAISNVTPNNNNNDNNNNNKSTLLGRLNSSNSDENKQRKTSLNIQNQAHIFIPWVLISRENLLVKKIVTHSKNFSFDLFDNGTIDNDTITIYDNKLLMLDKNRLSYNAIHFDINFSDSVQEHEIILVANNLGLVPPNTALLKYKDAKQNEELFINTNFTQNAKLIIQYQPPSK
jgi:hypothetical protein